QAWAAGAANNGWALLPLGNDGWDFLSAQGATAPRLTITYETGTTTAAPAPAPAPVPAPVLALTGGVSLAEGNSGSTAFVFTVTRSGDVTGTSSATWSVAGSGTSPAAASDFAGGVLPSGTVSFAAGETSKTVAIQVAGDTTVEANETFTLTLSGPSGATLGTARTTGTIVNDDTATSVRSTVSFQQGVNGYAGTRDTELRQAAATTSQATATSLSIDGDAPSGTGQDQQG
ncbi:Calx-beta domain-containing protein, partial [Falsiroseomonas oryziterrae]|uniref:Calx-beta domain-containing protein n=1 Tax=Falsiroseomonas oryziterrae TaxID=2911368 RepID=UPI003557A429